LKAVQTYGKNIRILMKNMENKIDKEICIAALKNKGSINHVPYKYRDEELLKLTLELKQDITGYPIEIITREMCLSAIKNKQYLVDIPSEFYNREIIMIAVRQEEHLLGKKIVPKEYLNQEL
jgi:hypothetical protein